MPVSRFALVAFITPLITLVAGRMGVAAAEPAFARTGAPAAAAEICGRAAGASRTNCAAVIKSGAFNQAAVTACASYDDDELAVSCLKTIKNRRFETAAVKACDRIREPSDATSCLAAIGDRSYDDENVALCDRKADAVATVRCFQNAGRAFAPVPNAGRVAWNGRQCSEIVRDPSTGRFKSHAELPAVRCLVPELTYFQWSDPGSSECTAYTACGAALGSVDLAYCKDKPNPFANLVATPLVNLGANFGANQATKSWPVKGFTWSGCYRSDTGTTIPFDRDGEFISECAPDTLYSWHPPEHLETALASVGPRQLLKLKPRSSRLFLWRTPIGSFGYGSRAVRIKLKFGTRFELVDFDNRECADLAEVSDVEKTVFVSTSAIAAGGGYSEYMLCSDGPVESWSADTAFGSREMELEAAWISDRANANQTDFDSLFGIDALTKVPWNMSEHWDDQVSPTDWTEKALRANMAATKERSGASNRVFFAPTAVPSLWNHFSTKRAGYFNYFDSSVTLEQTWPERAHISCVDR